jgi:pre-60S factor REI1
MLNIPRQSSEIFTCINCSIAFNNSESQREHYKTDWHRYNLKRKVADLPAVTLTDFNQRVQFQKSEVTSK